MIADESAATADGRQVMIETAYLRPIGRYSPLMSTIEARQVWCRVVLTS